MKFGTKVCLGLTVLAAGLGRTAMADYTFVNQSSEPGLASIIFTQYGASPLTPGPFPGPNNYTTFFNSTTGVTLTRVHDLIGGGGGVAGLTNIHNPYGGTTDQRWADGTTQIQFEVKYAGNTNTFGWYNGANTTFQTLLTTGSTTANLSGNFAWGLDSNGQKWASDPAQLNNDPGNDHFVSYAITGLPGGIRWLICAEDVRIGGGSDRDYNDMVVEVRAIPLPPETAMAAFGLAGLFGLGIVRRRRA